MDLPEHPNGTLNGPRDVRGPLVKEGSSGSFYGPNLYFFYIDLLPTDKLRFTAWFEVNPTFGSGVISY